MNDDDNDTYNENISDEENDDGNGRDECCNVPMGMMVVMNIHVYINNCKGWLMIGVIIDTGFVM